MAGGSGVCRRRRDGRGSIVGGDTRHERMLLG